MSMMARFKMFDATLVATSSNVASEAINISRGTGNFSLSYLASSVAASSGDIDINIDYEVSQDGVLYDTVTTSPSRSIVDALSNTTEITDGFNMPAAKFVRFRATGGASTNPSTTVLSGSFQFTED